MAEAERIIGTPGIPDHSGEPAAVGRTPGAAGADQQGSAPGRSRGRRRIAVLFVVASFAYALDLISKMLVVAKLEHHAPIEVAGDWLEFELTGDLSHYAPVVADGVARDVTLEPGRRGLRAVAHGPVTLVRIVRTDGSGRYDEA